MRQALAVGRKELRQIVRDPRTLLILLFIPVFFLLIFGYALNFDIRHVTLGVDDRDRSAESRELISGFTNSGYFDLVAVIRDSGEVERLMNRNAVRAVLVIPDDFSRRLNGRGGATVQVLINGENASAAATVMGYALAIVRGVSERLGRVSVLPAGGRASVGSAFEADRSATGVPPLPLVVAPASLPVEQASLPAESLLSVETRVWYNPELRSALFLVPGLITYIATITAIISTALSIVREKERGTMEQVRMAPMSTLAYVVGKTTPYFAIALVSSLLIVVASMWLFGVPMRGTWALLLLSLAIFLAGALGIGLLISTIADSQQMAFQLALIVAFMPTLILSGFIFPIANMPAPIRAVTYVVPARYFLFVLRGVMLKGIGLAEVWQALGALTICATVVLGLAAVRLKKQG